MEEDRNRPRLPSRLLVRPYALAGRPHELPVAAACVLALLLVFAGDATTPVQVAVSALGLIPLLAAMWLLSNRLALVVGVVAVGQLLATLALGALSPITVGSETAAYVALAILCRVYAGSIAGLLAAPRARGYRRALHGMATLTRREQQVVQLAATGYTAREIGQELHIGKRTVETHLVNAYDKLGVKSKRELMKTVPAGGTAPVLADG
jgi:DNA-binding CsgD family transcriptional regulator